jgi:hypothetical protein
MPPQSASFQKSSMPTPCSRIAQNQIIRMSLRRRDFDFFDPKLLAMQPVA